MSEAQLWTKNIDCGGLFSNKKSLPVGNKLIHGLPRTITSFCSNAFQDYTSYNASSFSTRGYVIGISIRLDPV